MYRIIQEEKNMEGRRYIVWGMEAYEGDNPSRPVKRIGDISTSRERVEELVQACNDGELSLFHMEDVVEDWLIG